jgi:hypothetical protein
MNGDRIGRQLSLATRRELIEAIAERYDTGTRIEKRKILDEFVEVTGFHRKHAIRALRKAVSTRDEAIEPAPRARIYGEAVLPALTILWEAADRICGKRLKEAVPIFVEAMERHGHLQLDAEVRRLVLAMSPAAMDRLLKPAREAGKQGRADNHQYEQRGFLSLTKPRPASSRSTPMSNEAVHGKCASFIISTSSTFTRATGCRNVQRNYLVRW